MKLRIILGRYIYILCIVVLSSACSNHVPNSELYEFRLSGGYFYGPGPIEPDTALPVGYLRNIRFDLESFTGYAEFLNDGTVSGLLSDGKTLTNQNIEAGVLEIGGGNNTVLLVAVKGGPNRGLERYSLNQDYSFVWTVDLALDPGFAEGIVSVNNFELTTGIIKISNSLQTDQGIPGGYDQAGSLKSGDYLVGRVGDFNQDGYLDGVVVAAPRVPLESNMLPGSPVGNKRGFDSDIAIPAHLAGELTLRGISLFEMPVQELFRKHKYRETNDLLSDIGLRFDSIRENLDRALIAGEWNNQKIKHGGKGIAQQLASVQKLNNDLLARISNDLDSGSSVPDSLNDVIDKLFAQTNLLIDSVSTVNKTTKQRLPSHKSTV